MTGLDDRTGLERALQVYLAWKRADPAVPWHELLARHDDLREMLAAMAGEETAAPGAQAPAAASPLAGRVLGGDFRIVAEIGRGGMGIVYRAQQMSLDRAVALKVLSGSLALRPESIARFRREAALAAKLRHPGIVRIHAVGSEGDLHFFAMELVEGVPLSQVLDEVRRERRAGAAAGHVERVVGLAIQVADALDHAHRGGVLHRDVKPSNILVRPSGEAVLTDFGLACEDGLPSVTMTGDFAGTPHYVSPEQAMSKRMAVDHRTDVFSLGATLYELVTLERPFPGDTVHEVLGRIVTKEPRDPQRIDPNLSGDLAAIVLKALEKDPDARYASAKDLADDLRAFLAYRPVQARRIALPRRAWRWAKRNPLVAGLAATLAVSLLVAGVWIARQNVVLHRALDDVYRLSDRLLLDRLAHEASVLRAAVPADASGLQDWIDRAGPLVERAPRQRERLQRLRAGATAVAGGRWQLESQERQWEHDLLAGFVDRLDRFLDESAGEWPRVHERLRFVQTVAARSLSEPARAWQQAIAAIADREQCPAYGGLRIAPQMGLVPLGRDGQSGLFEFAHLQTGEPAERGEDGRLVVGPKTGLVFVLLPGGEATIGSARPDAEHRRGEPYVDVDAMANESPVHTLELEPFFLAKHEMTQGQWHRLTGRNPSRTQDIRSPKGPRLGERLPVEMVTWEDCERVLGTMGLVLPSEAQWEYAARAGTSTPFYCGDDPADLEGYENGCDQSGGRSNSTQLRELLLPFDDGCELTAAVGSLRPNPLGLHDMLGNVSEWCMDAHGPYPTVALGRASNDPRANRVLRGGSYAMVGREMRASFRQWLDRGTPAFSIGVRPARRVDERP